MMTSNIDPHMGKKIDALIELNGDILLRLKNLMLEEVDCYWYEVKEDDKKKVVPHEFHYKLSGSNVIQKHQIENIEWSVVEDLFNLNIDYNLKSWTLPDIEKMHNATCELVQKWRRVTDSTPQLKQLMNNLELIQVSLGSFEAHLIEPRRLHQEIQVRADEINRLKRELDNIVAKSSLYKPSSCKKHINSKIVICKGEPWCTGSCSCNSEAALLRNCSGAHPLHEKF